MNPVRIVLADDHTVMRNGLRLLLVGFESGNQAILNRTVIGFFMGHHFAFSKRR